MKIARRIIALLLVVMMVATVFAGCGNTKKDDKVDDATGQVLTLRIHYHSSGYGHTWLEKMAEEFEKAYADIGYEVELTIEQGTSQTSAEQSIPLGPDKNDIDLYIASINLFKILDASNKTMRGEGAVLVDLTEIFESPAVGADRQPEEKTISERFMGDTEELYYDGAMEEFHGGIYAIPYNIGATGIVMNTAVMEACGITELPRTTDEFNAMHEVIMSKGKYPFAFAGANAPGYWQYLFEAYFAQYSGKEGVDNFSATMPESGDVVNDGWMVYQDKGLLEAFRAMEPIMDIDYCPNGSVNNTHLEAQHDLLIGDCAYIVSGDWLFNEMEKEYYEEGANCIMLKTPILSVIGEECGITDAQLSEAVKMIDEDKTNEEIMAAISGLDATETQRIRDARNVYCGIGSTGGVLIPAYADAIPAAKAFIQFMFSEDGCRIWRDEASSLNTVSCDSYEVTNPSKFMESVVEFVNPGEGVATGFDENKSDVRAASGMLWWNHSAYVQPVTFKSMMTDTTGRLTAEYIYETEIDYVRNHWAQWVSYAGLQ